VICNKVCQNKIFKIFDNSSENMTLKRDCVTKFSTPGFFIKNILPVLLDGSQNNSMYLLAKFHFFKFKMNTPMKGTRERWSVGVKLGDFVKHESYAIQLKICFKNKSSNGTRKSCLIKKHQRLKISWYCLLDLLIFITCHKTSN